MTKKSVFIVTILLLAISTFSFGSETDNVVVSLGDDLTNKQKEEILRLFNVEEDINTVKVTNQEERKYLGMS